MRILIFTNHFFPESFRVNDIAFDRAERGDRVKVLTAIPDYPEGRFHPGYSLFKRRCETVNGVEVVRVPVIPRGDGSKVRLMLQYGSSVVCFFFYALWQALFHRFDAVFVHDTSPAFIGLPAKLVGRIQKIPVYHWILDMWPESLAAGGIRGGKVYSLVEKMMRGIYRQDKVILISSRGSRRLLESRGVQAEKIVYLPNWFDDVPAGGLKGIDLPPIPSGFVVMFAGNLGEAQNLENVLAAAELTKGYPDIHWVFVGDGRKRPWMESFVQEHGLSGTVHLLGRFPIEAMPRFFEQADVMLVSLNDDPVFNLVLPAKVQAYMAAGKPILGMLCGEGSEVIAEARCGWSVPSGEVSAMAERVVELSRMSAEELKGFGENAFAYYQEHFTKEKCMGILEGVLRGD
jgi:glycosyltransferase involved in cell wall biosynthesis